MEWTISYDSTTNFVEIKRYGQYSENKIHELFEDLNSREFWKPKLPLLIDNSELDFGTFNYEKARKASEYYREIADRYGVDRCAWLVSSVRDFGIGRQIQMLIELRGLQEIRVFHDRAAAVLWLESDAENRILQEIL